jgi:OHCU decarboxylase
VVTTLRLGLASVAHAPFRCRNVEAALLGLRLDAAAIAVAQAALRGEIEPIDDIRSTGRYRMQVAQNLLAEFLAGVAPAEVKSLPQFNTAAQEAVLAKLLSWCGSSVWAREMAARRPFADAGSLLEAAETIWSSLDEAAWLEAFAAHPRIGERKPATTDYLAHSSAEQAAAQRTLAPVAARLAELNGVYEARFGFRYLVFADGRSAPELLAVLEERLNHTRQQELQEAARQQSAITRLRMTKWLQP